MNYSFLYYLNLKFSYTYTHYCMYHLPMYQGCFGINRQINLDILKCMYLCVFIKHYILLSKSHVHKTINTIEQSHKNEAKAKLQLPWQNCPLCSSFTEHAWDEAPPPHHPWFHHWTKKPRNNWIFVQASSYFGFFATTRNKS